MDREVLALRYFGRLGRGEAAQVLGISQEAGAKRYFRALNRLKDALATLPGGWKGALTMSLASGSRDYERFDALAEEFAERSRRGERPNLQEYVDRLPEMAEEIRDWFPALVEFEQADADARRDGSPPPPADSPHLRQIGGYRIVREIGRGGMGVVYEAEQVSLGRRVALKILPGHLIGNRRMLERFRREAKAAARLHHTNIVPVFEVGRDRDVCFYVMQLIQGQGLELVIDELRRRLHEPGRKANAHGPAGLEGPEAAAPLSQARVAAMRSVRQRRELGQMAESLLSGCRVTEGLCSPTSDPPADIGLEETERSESEATAGRVPGGARGDDRLPAHPAADRSSSAVLPGGTHVSEVDTSGRRHPYFRSVAQIGRQAAQGLAYAHARGIVHRDIKPSNLLLDTAGVVWITDFGLAKADEDGLTAPGDTFGTLRYMAPERFRGAGDARADIYALGLTLYELLTLKPAYETSDRLEMIERVKNEEPARPRTVDARIPRDLETIVLKAIDKDLTRRYATAEAMAEDLRRFLDDEPIRARQVSAAERYWRWARRNPAIAVLGGALTGVLMLVTAGSLLVAQRFRTQAATQSTLAEARETERKAADAARAQEAAANASLRAKEDELRRTVYATRSNLALAAWEANNVGLMRGLLDLMRPAPGQPDLRGWEWRYLWRLGDEARLTLRGQDRVPFDDVVFSPDGQTLAGLEVTGRIHLWDRRTGESRQTIQHSGPAQAGGLAGGIHALAFSRDGSRLAGPGPENSLALYDVATGQPALRFEGPPGAVMKLAWSPDGRTLVAAISAHVMRVWDARDGHLIHKVFGGHNGPVAAVAFSPDGRTLASARFDRTVKLWDPDAPARPRAVLRGHTDEVRALAFSPDGRRIGTAGLDRSVRVWDAASGATLGVMWGHNGAVTSLAFLPDGAKIVTGSTDETVRIWDAATGQELRCFKGQSGEVVAVALSPDGRDVASASGRGGNSTNGMTVRLWDAAGPLRPRTLQSPSVLAYGGIVYCLAFSPDGRRLASGHEDHALRVWELPSDRPPRVLKGHSQSIKCVAFSPDGRTLASGDDDGAVRLWDVDTGEPRLTFTGHTGALRALVFTPDGRTILSAGYDHTIQAWDPATGAVRYVLRGHSDSVHDLAFSPDGRTLASASFDKTCILWDFPSRQPRLTLRGHTDRVNKAIFSPDGRTVATASDDRTVRLWDPSDGSPRATLAGHGDEVASLAFDADGRLASSGSDKTIRIWDCASGQALLVLNGHTLRVRCVEFSPDGQALASASYDRTIKLWEAAPTAVLASAGVGPATASQTRPDAGRLLGRPGPGRGQP